MEEKARFIRVSEPNKDEMARLLLKAKGPERTMKELAALCGVDPSTLSRIVNKMNRGPSSDDLIRSIAEHADPESGVTLDILMAAHGMAKVVDSATAVKISPLEVEESFKNTMLYNLEREGVLDGYIEDARFQVGVSYRLQIDLLLRSKEIEGNSNLWGLELLMPQLNRLGGEEENSEGDIKRTTHMLGQMILDRMGKILPLFYNQKDNNECLGKFSFVVVDRRLFDYLRMEFADYCVPFNMSFLLFNSRKEMIEQEFNLKRA